VKRLALNLPLTLGAIGVVFGDIGTSPLYALRECFSGPRSLPVTEENLLGVLSLIFWSLTLIVSIKYVFILLRIHNNGEGGIFALHALLSRGGSERRRRWVYILTLLGASFLFSDGMITPAISVLSAVEGIGVYSPDLSPLVLPLSALILFILFRIQYLGTGGVSSLFAPLMLLWFASIALWGFLNLLSRPGIVLALSPFYAIEFFRVHHLEGVFVLGAVFLAVTGAEALYADLGHFGPGPIRRAWFLIAKPAVLLNYFGQGAYLLQHPGSQNPFYDMVSGPFLIPMIVIATTATIIASQALISGAYSLAQQAVQLGYLPRLRILHTSPEIRGRIYIPLINWILATGVLLLVFLFRTSSSLSHAYGVAISADMMITTLLLIFFVLRTTPSRFLFFALSGCAILLGIEGVFLTSNLMKILHGGFVPILISIGSWVLMDTWRKGREILREKITRTLLDLKDFIETLSKDPHPPLRVPGTAVFLNSLSEKTPPALLHAIKHIPVLHERIIILTIQVDNDLPRVNKDQRIFLFENLGLGFFRVVALYGFMDSPDMGEIFSLLGKKYGLDLHLENTTFFLGRETLLTTGKSSLSPTRKALFAFLSRNAIPAPIFFKIPPGRVVELGMQVDL